MPEAVYLVGRFTLIPFRELMDGPDLVPIGRKPLEILSVLARANGALVTKDEVMAAVWPDLIVEENAVQAHIAGLRKILGEDARLLTTARALGYRLAATPAGDRLDAPAAGASATAAPAPRTPIRSRRIRPLLLIALSITAAVFAAGLWWFSRDAGISGADSPPRVAVLPIAPLGNDQTLASVADGATSKLLSSLNAGQIVTLSPPAGAGTDPARLRKLGATFVIAGTVARDGRRLRAHVTLDDVRTHVTLWTKEFSGDLTEAPVLEGQVAATSAYAATTAVALAPQAAREPNTVSEAIRVRILAGFNSEEDLETVWQKSKALAEQAPHASISQANFAIVSALLAAQSPPDRARELRALSLATARRAKALDPKDGMAYLPFAILFSRPGHWSERERVLLEGVNASPDQVNPDLHFEGLLLAEVGRLQDSLEFERRAVATDQLSPNKKAGLARSLANVGLTREADQVLADAVQKWPTHGALWAERLHLAMAERRWAAAQALLADGAYRPPALSDTTVRAWRIAFSALASNTSESKSFAVRALRSELEPPFAFSDTAAFARGVSIELLSELGEVDAAFAEARRYLQPSSGADSSFLFTPMTHALRQDPQFMMQATRLGLVDYWRRTGRWPDFCADEGLPYDCKAEAAKHDHGTAAQSITVSPN
jgi:DNA-binding winged helix-turn-helix (wHTH) protein/TolB-like protein